MTAAAERTVTFGSCFYRWTARLLSCLGSSAAQGIGGRVIAPLQVGPAYVGRVRTSAPTGDLEAALSLGGGMRATRAPSSVTASPCPPTPFVPSGHFPLIGGIVLSPWGKRLGRLIAAPTVHRKPVGAHSMRPPEFAPVPLVRKRQARERNRTSPNFPPTQAPSGAGRDRTQALLILRAGNVLPTSRGNPRKWGPGKAVLWT